jgi:hypothetical protein
MDWDRKLLAGRDRQEHSPVKMDWNGNDNVAGLTNHPGRDGLVHSPVDMHWDGNYNLSG